MDCQPGRRKFSRAFVYSDANEIHMADALADATGRYGARCIVCSIRGSGFAIS